MYLGRAGYNESLYMAMQKNEAIAGQRYGQDQETGQRDVERAGHDREQWQ